MSYSTKIKQSIYGMKKHKDNLKNTYNTYYYSKINLQISITKAMMEYKREEGLAD